MKQGKKILIILVILLVIVFFIVGFMNSKILSEIRIKIKPEVKEKSDMTLNQEEKLLDYKLKVISQGKGYLLGTKINTSAQEWLIFPVKELIPWNKAQEIHIIEEDPIKNDLLDKIQITGENSSGTSYDCQIFTTRSFDGGLIWFFNTPIGKAIFLGIMIGIICSILFFFFDKN
ncbi:MAG: hypothetical protein AABZ60_16310 [Planctomycetota bacterium]